MAKKTFIFLKVKLCKVQSGADESIQMTAKEHFFHSFLYGTGCFVQWSFRSKYKKLFRPEPEFCLIDSFFYPTKERNNSLFLERKCRGMK